ncbi:hypothetical protein LJC22_01625 [Desulfosarcina sp. OttesenSCG-928-G10]|nr:hypothetical protein [Desulfosarcina sp. OttesenSCG-928-G10]MDL2321802.1 hypothetical protein [Desulfosarcina sp. OttesenSCG-928-B08]
MMKLRYILILCIVFILILVAGSLIDEDLTPETRKALNRKLPTAPPDQNAYVGIAGFNAPETEDFLEAGKKPLARVEAELGEWNAEDYPQELSITESYKNSCFNPDEKACLTALENDIPRIARLLEENAELIRRYRILQDMPLYVNTGFTTAEDIPNFMQPLRISDLLSAVAFLDIKNGNAEKGLDFIEKDMAFYKRIIAGKDVYLIDVLLAGSRIRNYALGVSRLIEAGVLDLQIHGNRLRRLIEPLPDPLSHMADIFEMELAFGLRGVLGGFFPDPMFDGKVGRFVEKMLTPVAYKKNMTMNRFTTVMEELIRQTRTMGFSPNTAPHLAEMRKTNEMSIFNIPLLYRHNGIFFWKNYMGVASVHGGYANYTWYVAAICDTTVFMHLARAQLELALSEYQSGDPSQVLMRLGPETFNPYTGAPFSWDADKQVLWFERAGYNDKQRAEVGLPFSKISHEEAP